jgi:YD repeat-containing protein
LESLASSLFVVSQQRTTTTDTDASRTFSYDLGDDMTSNSAVGSYSYATRVRMRCRALAGRNTPTSPFCVSGGNMLSGRGKSFSYDGLNRPVQIVTPAQTVGFAYGPDDQRLTKTVSGAVTLYLGSDEEIASSGGHVKYPSRACARSARR